MLERSESVLIVLINYPNPGYAFQYGTSMLERSESVLMVELSLINLIKGIYYEMPCMWWNNDW